MPNSQALPYPTVAQTAFFFDVDGTLVGFQDQPEQVRLSPDTISLLKRLEQAGGKIALVSGRTIASVQQVIFPFQCPIMGVHGAQYCDVKIPESLHGSPRNLADISSALKQALEVYPGCFIEDKGLSIAIHYRQASHFRDELYGMITNMFKTFPELSIMEGKCVWEIGHFQSNKGDAIRYLMTLPDFKDKHPIFIGDDVTDEFGFNVINQIGGDTIKVGSGKTSAQYRLNTVNAVHHWIEAVLQKETLSMQASDGEN